MATKNSSTNGSNGESNRTKSMADVEDNQQRLPYPKRVFFIISNEFCERFTYYGMKAVLVLYMTQKLLLDEDTATVLYHAFNMMVYFMCTFGAILSDVWLGKFKTILLLSMVYTIGSVVVSLGAIPTINISAEISLYIGLLLIAVGSGGIKPCVSAFGGDQFKMPQQAAQMATFFSLFYFSINSGSLISIFVTPVLRADVHCFGDNDCYPLAFGVPAILMITSILIFLLGKPLYTIKPAASGNMVVQVTKCISTAISTKRREKKTNPREHFLDYATEKCGPQLVNDTKILLKILVLYLPLPLFWALFDQQGSRWTFQATRLDGDIGFYEIKPDQMQVFNPLLILVFIPLYDAVFYPLLSKVGLRRPLQKLTAGGILAGIAFLLSAFVEFQLEETYPVLPGVGEAQLRLFNGLPCDYNVVSDNANVESFTLKALRAYEQKHIPVKGELNFTYTMNRMGESVECPPNIESKIYLNESTAWSTFVTKANIDFEDFYIDDPDKSHSGDPKVRFLFASNDFRQLIVQNSENSEVLKTNTTDQSLRIIFSGTYSILIDDKPIATLNLKQGGVYTVIFRENANGTFESQKIEIATPNSLSMLWLIPQYVVMTLGEVMFSVTGLAFSYAQAPESMKSVIQACWLLAVAFGNALFVIVVEVKMFKSQAFEFLVFAGLMFLNMIIFMILAYRYKGHNDVVHPKDVPDTDNDETQTKL